MIKVFYASEVGSLMYVMICIKPDIAQAVNVVSRYIANLGKEHWEAVKWLLRNLQESSYRGLLFRKVEDSTTNFEGYID